MSDQYMGQIRVGLGQPGPSTSMAPKRPFQTLESGGEEIQDSSPGCSSTAGASPNKRARSEGSPSTDAGSSGSDNAPAGSSSSGHMPVQPLAEFDITPIESIPDPRPPPPTLPSPTHLLTVSNHLPMPTRSPLVDIHRSPLLPLPYSSTPVQSIFPHHPVPPPSDHSFEATLQRAHDFELQIAAIREDISNSGVSSTQHFPPAEPPRHSHSPFASRASHNSDLPSVEQFLNDIRSRSPPSSSTVMQTLVGRRERLLSTLSLLQREREERQTSEREEAPRARPSSMHNLYLADVPRSPQLPQYLQLYDHILSDHLPGAAEDDYLRLDPFYIGQAATTDSELPPLPLGLERELEEAREELRAARPRVWATQSNPRTLFPHRSSRLDDDGLPIRSTWNSSGRTPSASSADEIESRLGRRRIPEFIGEELEADPWVLTRWSVDAEPGGTWSDRSSQRQRGHGWLPDRDRTRERDEELRQRALARINESTSLLRLPPSSPPPAPYWHNGHHDNAYMTPTTQSVADTLLEQNHDASHMIEGATSLGSVLQGERRARRLPERFANASVHPGRDRELRDREGQPTLSSVLPPFADFRTCNGFVSNTGQDPAPPYLRTFRSEHSSRPTIFRPPSPHLAPSRASPPSQPPAPTTGRTEAASVVGPSPPPPESVDTTSIFRNFDLSAYTGGPFRASLSTFRDMNRRRERVETRTQRYWDHELDRERGREIERELNLERELDRERERQRERRMELIREESMLQNMLSRRHSTSVQARTEDHETFAPATLLDPDTRFRRIMEPPIRAAPRALDSAIHQSFPLPSPQSPRLPPTSSNAERRDPWNDPPLELNRTPSFHQRRRLPVPLPIQRQHEVEDFNIRAHMDHPRSRISSSPWSAYESTSHTEARVQREPGRSRRELHELLTRRTRIEVARRLSEEAQVPGSPLTASPATAIPPPHIPSWDAEMVDFEYPIFEDPGLRLGGLERAGVPGPSVSLAGPSVQSGPNNAPGSEQSTSAPGLTRGPFRGPRVYHSRDANPTNTSIFGPGLVRRTPTSRSPVRGDNSSNAGPSTPTETSGLANSASTRSATRVTRRAGRHRRYTARMRNMGDYIRDEDFDGSFEGLMNLSAALGEVKPKNTPSHIIGSLPSGKYSQWAAPGCDERCPVCLDDYQADDELLKITDCSHWFHRGCLEQWLTNANTCPVCRKHVEGKKSYESTTNDGQPEAGPSRRRGNGDDDEDGPFGSSSNSRRGFNHPPPGAGAGAWSTFPPWYL